MATATAHRYFDGLSRNTLFLTFANLFADISTVLMLSRYTMVHNSNKSTNNVEKRKYRLAYGCWPCSSMQAPYTAN